jgi:hypothetical protein
MYVCMCVFVCVCVYMEKGDVVGMKVKVSLYSQVGRILIDGHRHRDRYK